MAKTDLTEPHHYPKKGDTSPKPLIGQIWKSIVIVATSTIAILVPLQLVLYPGDNPLPNASGMTLDRLGEGLGYEGPTARKRAWFLLYRTADPRISTVLAVARTLGVKMNDLVK